MTPELTAEQLRSGDVPVLGTPAVLALLEEAAVAAVRDELGPGETTVGVSADVRHLAPSAVGAHVTAVAELAAVDGRKLDFDCRANEGDTLIATARHRRAVVDREKFLSALR